MTDTVLVGGPWPSSSGRGPRFGQVSRLQRTSLRMAAGTVDPHTLRPQVLAIPGTHPTVGILQRPRDQPADAGLRKRRAPCRAERSSLNSGPHGGVVRRPWTPGSRLSRSANTPSVLSRGGGHYPGNCDGIHSTSAHPMRATTNRAAPTATIRSPESRSLSLAANSARVPTVTNPGKAYS